MFMEISLTCNPSWMTNSSSICFHSSSVCAATSALTISLLSFQLSGMKPASLKIVTPNDQENITRRKWYTSK